MRLVVPASGIKLRHEFHQQLCLLKMEEKQQREKEAINHLC